MKNLIAALFVLSAMQASAESVCSTNNAVIGAKYILSTATSNGKKQNVEEMVLLRNKDRVAHQYAATGITEIWEKTKNDRLRLVRNFDKYSRAIEYDPSEYKGTNGKNGWSLKTQLVSDNLLKSMHLSASKGTGCEKIESYVKSDKDETLTLDWYPNLRLVKRFSVTNDHLTKSWTMQSMITERKEIENVFKLRDEFYATDYTDIGDSESDPFLRKMINLGFVEHGGTEFYDADGNKMDGGHGHNHPH